MTFIGEELFIPQKQETLNKETSTITVINKTWHITAYSIVFSELYDNNIQYHSRTVHA